MSQRKAKEYRQAMRQYDGVARDVDDLKRRVGVLEVYNKRERREAAFDRRCLKELHQEKLRKHEELGKQTKTLKYELLAVAVLVCLMCALVIVNGMKAEHIRADTTDDAASNAVVLQGSAGNEAALLASGYYSEAVPMPYEYQGYMREYCRLYGCPYPLALAVAETESSFRMDAVGGVGEVGIMQLNPGPSGTYHDWTQPHRRETLPEAVACWGSTWPSMRTLPWPLWHTAWAMQERRKPGRREPLQLGTRTLYWPLRPDGSAR